MGRFAALQQWQSQAASAAAPAGMQQAAAGVGREAPGGGGRDFSALSEWTSQQGYVSAAQGWYSGANTQGTNNGWDNQFADDFITGQQQAADQGTLATYFEDGGTGVVTYDHDSSDGQQHYRFGDIYEKGIKTGNVYHQFDEGTADLMMADWLFDTKTKGEIFSASDRTERLHREVADKREYNNEFYAKSLSAADFQEGVTERAEDWQEGNVDEAIVGGGAVGGAVTGGAAGAALTAWAGPGALVGAIGGAAIGGALGGLGSYLNKDTLTEQAARAYEITSLSTAENGIAAGLATGVSQWAGFGGKLINPVSNTVQGYADWSRGTIGDGRSEFYAVDDQGHSHVPTWLKVAGFGAAVSDAAIQFATPVGLALYTTQMGGVIVGEVGEMALSGGKTFDYSSGGFDNVFTDDEGHFDPWSGAAGIGAIGIDVVQLGFARGLAGKVDSAATSVGAGSVYQTGRLGVSSLVQRMPGITLRGGRTRLGGWDSAQAKVLKQGGETAEGAGYQFVKNAEGTIVGPRRPTMQLLAPSEQLSALSARVEAMRGRAIKDGAWTSDDFYRAALRLSQGERPIQTLLVNAMGEGYEEGIQTVFESYSHGYVPTGDEIWDSTVMGFAGGLGMGAGAAARMPSAQARLFAAADLAHRELTGVPLDKDRFAAMDPAQQRSMAAMSELDLATLKAARGKARDETLTQASAGIAGLNAMQDAVQTRLSSELANKMPATDGSFVVTQIESAPVVNNSGEVVAGSMPSDAIGASGFQTARNMENHLRGITVQLRQLEADAEVMKQRSAAAPADQELADAVAKAARDIDMTKLTRQLGLLLFDQVQASVTSMYADSATEATITAEAEALNLLLRDAFHMRIDTLAGRTLTADDKMALAHAASMVFTRYPQDQGGSFQVLVPQVSAKLTVAKGAGNDQVQISHAVIPSMRADFDGDRLSARNQLILDETDFITARSGSHYIGAAASVNVPAPSYEKYHVEQLADALTKTNSAVSSYATGTLTDIGSAIKDRYSHQNNVVPPKVVDEVLVDFFDKVHTGASDARKALLDGLAAKAGGAMTEFARGNLSNEWLWIDQVVRAHFDRFQTNYAAHRPADISPNMTNVAPEKRSQKVRERIAAAAATTGATMAQHLTGTSLFRMFQKLHYSSYTAPVLSAADAREDRLALVEQAELYELLGSGMTKSSLDEIHAKDEITARVLWKLERLATDAKKLHPQLNQVEAMALVANMAVFDMDVNADGTVLPSTHKNRNGQISLAQMLLKQELARWRSKVDPVFATSPEMQAKWFRLNELTKPGGRGVASSNNAERAFVEVVGAQQLFRLLGEDAQIFGPHLTAEQWVRQYSSLSEDDRKREDNKIRSEAAYLGRKEKRNMPYSLDEVTDRDGVVQISAFRAVADAMMGAGHGRITMDAKGVLTGEFAEASDRVSKDFFTFHRSAREAVWAAMDLDPGAAAPGMDRIEQMMEANPDFARKIFALIPAKAAPAVFQMVNGKMMVSNWVYQMILTPEAAEAEMILWRNVLMSELRAANVWGHTGDDDTDDEHRQISYLGLNRRMHRVMWNLAANRNQLGQAQFEQKLNESTNLEDFIRWVNTAPGIRGHQAPLTAWVDDVSQFDKDKAEGGWGSNLDGAALREAMRDLQKSAVNLAKDLADERVSLQADAETLNALERVVKFDAGDTSIVLQEGDRDLYSKATAAIDEAAKLGVGMGPASMIYQTIGAVRGFNPQSHTKGMPADNVALQGAFDALADAFDYTVNYERVMASLTALNLDAVNGSMAMVAKDPGRAMDDDGHQVEWEKPTVAGLVALMRKPSTRGMARAMLFPQVQERTSWGTLETRLLVDKDLKGLLKGTHHRDLFTENAGGHLDQDAALRYCAMVEAVARREGGHFSLQRAVNDIVIAQMSAAGSVQSTADLEKIVIEAYRDVARVLQKSGAVASKIPENPDDDVLGDVLKRTRIAQRRAGLNRRIASLDLATAEGDTLLTQLLQEYQLEAGAEKQALIDASGETKNTAERLRLVAAAKQIDVELKQYEERLNLLRADDIPSLVRDTYGYDETWPEDQKIERQKVLAAYLVGNMRMVETSAKEIVLIQKLTGQLLDSGRHGRPDLSDAEWRRLGNEVIATHIAQTLVTPGIGMVPAFPDGDRADDQRYYDPSYSYLAIPLVDPASPLVKAAAHIQMLAGRYGDDASVDENEIYDLMANSIFDPKKLGPWTPDVPRSSIEANERLDSAAAAAGIAIAGNPPKRQAVISAATRRTKRKPDDSLLSTVSLSVTDLGKPDFEPISVLLAGSTTPEERPKAQLNNRFTKSVVMRYRNPADPAGEPLTVDLLATDPNLGWKFAPEPDVRDSGYSATHPERIKDAVSRSLADLGLDETAVVDVQMAFFHPDSQPLDEFDSTGNLKGLSWYNNIYFEGTSFIRDADQGDSLTATLWFANDALTPRLQAWALDSQKLGQLAMQKVDLVTAAQRKQIESTWQLDFAKMLRDKTQALLEMPLGDGTLDSSYYNAVYKDMKLRHFVRGKDKRGKQVLWDAEKVINWQRANPPTADADGKLVPAPLPFEVTGLWVPSDDVLRSLLGEQQTQGVNRLFPDQLEIDLHLVPTYRGASAVMLEKFGEGIGAGNKALEDTWVSNRARQQVLVVRPHLTDPQLGRYDARLTWVNRRREQIHNERAAYRAPAEGAPGFSSQNTLATMVQNGTRAFRAENISMDWSPAGVMFFGPRRPTDLRLSSMVLSDLVQTLGEENGFKAGWTYRHNKPGMPTQGVLSKESLDESTRSPAMHVAPDDVVLMELDSFERDIDKMKETARMFAGWNATIVLGSANGETFGRPETARYLAQLGYKRVAGSDHVWKPEALTSRFQNLKAHHSKLTEVQGVSPRSRLALLHVKDKAITESSMYVKLDNPRMPSIKAELDLVKTDFMAGYNLPVGGQVTEVVNHLRGLNTSEGKQLLLKQANGHITDRQERSEADTSLLKAFDEMIRRFDAYPGEVMPPRGEEFGTGDLVPLYDGHRVMLYRHGYVAPQRERSDQSQPLKPGERPSLVDMVEMEQPGHDGGANVAIFPSKLNTKITPHRGTVVRYDPRSGHGLQVELQIPLSVYGDKKILEWNGMKYETVPWPDDLVMPPHGILPDGRGIDGIVQIDDTTSKEAYEDLVTSHRNAFAFLGIDFTDDIAKSLGTSRQNAIALMNSIAYRINELPIPGADLLMHAPRISANIAQLLGEVANEMGEFVDPAWVQTLASPSSVEDQITSAMIIYLCTPGAELRDVLRSGSIADESPDIDSQGQKMPTLFTQMFDLAPMGSELRTEMFKRFNEALHNPFPDVGYSLDQNWTFRVHNGRLEDPKTPMLQPGDQAKTSAFDGWSGPLYHGTITEGGLPETLSPRGSGVRDSKVGPGFYTTDRLSLAKGYGDQGVYQILGTKSGQPQKVFDLDTAMTDEDLQQFSAVLRPMLSNAGLDVDAYSADVDYYQDRAKEHPGQTWRALFARMQNGIVNGIEVQPLVTEYLVNVHGAGAVKYSQSRAAGPDVSVVVSLKPEDLQIARVDPETGKLMQSTPDTADSFPGNTTKRPQQVVVGQPHRNIEGHLQFPEVHSSGDNPISNGMAFDERGKQSVSVHTAYTAYQAVGGRTPYHRLRDGELEPIIAKTRKFASGEGIKWPDRDDVDGGEWRTFSHIPLDAALQWRIQTPGEVAHRDLGAHAVVQFRQPLEFDEEHGWTTKPQNMFEEYDRLRLAIVHALGLTSKHKHLVDYWVRQMLGTPVGTNDEGQDVGWVAAKAAIGVATEMETLVNKGYLPVVSGMVPLMHVQDLQLIHRMNKDKDRGWAPRESTDAGSPAAKNWDQWVEVSLGSALLDESLFYPIYLTAVDGFMHTYQNATRAMLDMPVSLDSQKTRALLGEDVNNLIVSFDPNTELLAKNPIQLETTHATINELIGGRLLSTGLVAQAAPAAAITQQRNRIKKWVAETGQPFPVAVTKKNFRKNGAETVERATSTGVLYRIMLNLRIGTALLNPALYVSMGPEMWVRGSLDRLANNLTMQGTAGMTARLQTKASDMLVKKGRTSTAGKAVEGVGKGLEHLGLTHRYTDEQRLKLTRLYKSLGSNPNFGSMVNKEMWFRRPHPSVAIGRVEKITEAYAKWGTKVQDPTFGTKTNTLARRYLEAALQHIAAQPTKDIINVDQLAAAMARNPEFLKDRFPDAHAAGMNSVAQIRSLKQTPLSLALKGVYEPLAESDKMLFQFVGNIVMKIPMIFSGYGMNVLTTVTGMQGVSDMTAMFLHGRNKGLIGRIQKSVRGANVDEDDNFDTFDMTEVMEGIDLTRSFIRGGLTHTGLFVLGMMAQGFNLSGEDDETRKRRLLSKLQGTPFVYDPRAIQNDFRNSDAVFLDNLPFGFGHALVDTFGGDAGSDMMQLHWMLKQFVSPIVGMERFFETGDYRQIMWGFQDALGSFPLINMVGWSDAVHTAAAFVGLADKEAQRDPNVDGDTGVINGFNWLATSVGVYEKMLFENSFVNALYVGRDRWDRDPYALPLRDSDGTIQRDIEGLARTQDISVEQYIVENRDRLTREIAGGKWQGELYIDPDDGNIKQAYLQRDGASAALHALTENRGTMALVTSLFTGAIGGESDYWRYNMPVKTREMSKPPVTEEEVEKYLLEKFAGTGAPRLSESEITSLIWKDVYASGVFTDGSVVDKVAAERFANERPAVLSISVGGREHLTEAGARAIFHGLSKGSVTTEDSSLRGIYITPEMRESIQAKWTKEIIQEGVDLGLDKTKATSRMKRLWYGPIEDPSIPGLGDILWSKDISFDDTLKFQQLNTTYVMGPDGRPWATGFARDGLLGAVGLRPLKGQLVPGAPLAGQDERFNTTYLGAGGINTGLRALEPIDESRFVPTDVEIGKSIEAAIKDAAKSDYVPQTPYPRKSGSGYTPYKYTPYRHSYGGYGGGGGGGGYPNFSRMYAMPHGRSPYSHNIPFINTSNPLIRRESVHRERVWSEKGRLKQWQ